MNILSATLMVTLTIWTTSISSYAQTGTKEECDKNVFDNCANRLLMLSDENFIFPTNTEKMNKRCKELKTLEKCVKDYSKNCLKGETKNSISVLMVSLLV